ncbi:MAG TPA: ACT domain-containing protein [Casimicrobiaceae bacterium]|nr:ACT domain-containing protein [Casimicrobiaceae bacterium]
MNASVVLTLIGPNTTGIVFRVAQIVGAHGGNWLGARMANLAGQFAGIVQLELPQDNVERFSAALGELDAIGMRFLVAKGDVPAAASGPDLLRLEVVGHDHPGIVRDIADVLARHGVSIEQLSTDRVSGAFSGESLFKAIAQVRLPEHVATRDLRAALESVAHEVMVDIALESR